ncbi:MAG: GNAT family N-acetyltransferase [Oscillospiraceae bacterium]
MHDITIATERLLLRPLTEEDAPAVFAWVGDERVSRYMVYTTYASAEQVRGWLKYIETNTSTYNFGFVRKSDGLLIGSGDIGRETSESGETWGFGYNLRFDCWGMGYATEAARGMMDYVHSQFGAQRFFASHAEPNTASGRVMEKCGLRFSGYGEFRKLDGSVVMRSKEYTGTWEMGSAAVWN